MARRGVSIDEKIELQKQVVFKAKDKYDSAVAELDRLMKKRDELRQKELLEAFAHSSRSFEEIMKFLQGEEENTPEE